MLEFTEFQIGSPCFLSVDLCAELSEFRVGAGLSGVDSRSCLCVCVGFVGAE